MEEDEFYSSDIIPRKHTTMNNILGMSFFLINQQKNTVTPIMRWTALKSYFTDGHITSCVLKQNPIFQWIYKSYVVHTDIVTGVR